LRTPQAAKERKRRAPDRVEKKVNLGKGEREQRAPPSEEEAAEEHDHSGKSLLRGLTEKNRKGKYNLAAARHPNSGRKAKNLTDEGCPDRGRERTRATSGALAGHRD